VYGQQCHGRLKGEHSMRVGQIIAGPWTYMYDISVADTTCCRQSADRVVSGCRRWRKLYLRSRPGAFRDEQNALWCTVWCQRRPWSPARLHRQSHPLVCLPTPATERGEDRTCVVWQAWPAWRRLLFPSSGIGDRPIVSRAAACAA